MSKKKNPAAEKAAEVVENDNLPKRVQFDPVEQLESVAKCGFFTQQRPADESIMEPMVRLCCEKKDPLEEPYVLTPWCSTITLAGMVQGCMYLNPLIIRCIKENHSNAPVPESESGSEKTE